MSDINWKRLIKDYNITLGTVLRISYWELFNKNKYQILINKINMGMLFYYAYEQTKELK